MKVPESRRGEGAHIAQPAFLALGLFLLAPLVAEFLLGNLPITALGSLLVLAPLYGGGALLIREAARRLDRGWPTLLAWGLAYALLEEGIVTMSLFNPGYAGANLLDAGFVSALGIGVPWTVQVLTMHCVWSIAVPIALVEALAGSRRAVPWLGRRGLTLTTVVFAAGVALNTLVSVALFRFVAAPSQLLATGLLVLALVVGGLAFGRQSRTTPRAGGRRTPSPWLVGGVSFLASGVFRVLPLPGWWSRNLLGEWPPWLLVVLVALLAVGMSVAVIVWSHRPGWREPHRLALAGGALLTYAWAAFPQRPVLSVDPAIDLAGNAVFAVGAAALLVTATRLQAAGCDDASAPIVNEPSGPQRGW